MTNSSSPSNTEFVTLSSAVYALTSSNGIGVPIGDTVPGTSLQYIGRSNPSLQSDGFSAAAFKDPAGNVIIAFEGTVPGSDTYGSGTLGADLAITRGQSPAALQDAIAYAQQIKDQFGSKRLTEN